MKPDEFMALTWRQYLLMRSGWQYERSYEFEHTRLIVYQIAATIPTKTKLPRMQKFWPLITDPENEIKEQKSLKELQLELIERINKNFNKNLSA